MPAGHVRSDTLVQAPSRGRKGIMSKPTYAKPEKIILSSDPDFNERLVQERIAEDPSILGLGDLILKDQERIHPHAGGLVVAGESLGVALDGRAGTDVHRVGALSVCLPRGEGGEQAEDRGGGSCLHWGCSSRGSSGRLNGV
jgi:hypothetical protein